MSDYIDRKALQKELNDWYDYHYPTASGATDRLHMDINQIVKNMPSVDAVEVVRCKDCKHSVDHYVYGCWDGLACKKLGDRLVNDDDYCKWGEKNER